MSQTFSTDELIVSIKRRGMIPTSQKTFSNEDFLALATEHIQTEIAPALIMLKQGFFEAYEDYAITPQIQSVPIPERALGSVVVAVGFTNETTISNDSCFTKVKMDRPWNGSSSFGFNQGVIDPVVVVEHNKLVLKGFSSHGIRTLRVWYNRRPATLVLSQRSSQIDSTPTETRATVKIIPSDFATGQQVDIIKGRNHSDLKQMNNSIVALDAPLLNIDFANDLPVGEDAVVAGDWISKAGTSPVIDLPLEWSKILAYRVAEQVLSSLNDRTGADSAKMRGDKLEALMMRISEPRNPSDDNSLSNSPLGFSGW